MNNKIYCQICKIHNSEFHCSKCVNKYHNLIKSEIHSYEFNIKKNIENVKNLEKNCKLVSNKKNNLENCVNEYEIQIQEKAALIQKKKEDINKKKKELEIRKQNLLELLEKLKLKQDEDLKVDKKLKKSKTNSQSNLNRNIKEELNNENKNSNKINKNQKNNNDEIDFNIFIDSNNVKKLINRTYLKTYEQLNNQLMCARQILIRELSKIFKLQKITGNITNNYSTNVNPATNNISSFLNNSISQVLHDTPISTISKIFGISESETDLNNSIYNNPNFSLYEDITTNQEINEHKSKYHSQLSKEGSQNKLKTKPIRNKNSYLYNRNLTQNHSNYKYAKKKRQNISETYTILGYSFPPINEIWNYSHDKINISLEYIIQYIILLSYYLDIKLPFSIHYQGVRSYVECHLYNCTCYLPLCYSEKTIEEFLTGLSMLCYDVIYLCYTQGVIVEDENVLNILENIYKCTKSPFLGQTLNSDMEFHQHSINFSMLPNSYNYTKQKITQKIPQNISFNNEVFKRKISYSIINNTLGNSFNLRFSEIVKLIFLHANVQIPINNNMNGINSSKSEASTPTSLNNNDPNIEPSSSLINKYQQTSSIEWNDIDFNIETMTINDKEIDKEYSPKSSRDKNIELLNSANKKLKSILSINNIIHTEKKGSNNNINNQNENNNATINYLSNTNIINDDLLMDDPSKNNNIFDYENVMGAEEQIRKQRLTEFLSCVFHDYFSNRNTNEWVLIDQ